MATKPPVKFVEPTLVTSAVGTSSGSMTTSGRSARAKAVRSPAVMSLTTAMTAQRPAAASPRAHAVSRSTGSWCWAGVRRLKATATELVDAVCSTPSMISVQ